MKLTPDDPGYPDRLRKLIDPPPLTVSAPLESPGLVVAIVGSRGPVDGAARYAFTLAQTLATLGVTVASGGAKGIDRAAHEGALAVGGRTWLVAPHGRRDLFPPENADLFARVEASPPSAMIWPFSDDVRFESKHTPHARNRTLVALADAVVVVQAYLKSGSLNALRHALDQGKKVWVVPAPPWAKTFAGSLAALAAGRGEPLWSTELLLRSLGLETLGAPESSAVGAPAAEKAPPSPPRPRPLQRAPDASWTQDENTVFSSTSAVPSHIDAIAGTAALSVPRVISALLTLSLKNVLVEGPDGFFRRSFDG